MKRRFIYLTEGLKIDQLIATAIEKAGLTIDPEDGDMTVELGKTEKTFNVDGTQRKAGGIIRKLVPSITDLQLNAVLGIIKAERAKKSTNIELSDDVSGGYQRAYDDSNVSSCMSGMKRLTKFYDGHPNVQIALVHDEDGGVVARALVWHNVVDEDGNENTYVDKVYPAESNKYATMIRDWAHQQKWWFRKTQSSDDYRTNKNKQIYFDVEFDKPINFPWADTMLYAYPREGFISNKHVDDYRGNEIEIQSTGGVRVEPAGWGLKKLVKKYRKSEKENDDGIVEIHDNVDLAKQQLEEIPAYFNDKIVVGSFNVSRNQLRSLRNSPIVVTGNYDVFFNRNITSLEGCPKEVNGHFRAYGLGIRSLAGAPEKVGRSFNVSKNPNLTSLEGGPEQVGYRYWAHSCGLTSLNGIASTIKKGEWRFDGNPSDFSDIDVRNAMTGAFDKEKDIEYYSDEEADWVDMNESAKLTDIYNDILNG